MNVEAALPPSATLARPIKILAVDDDLCLLKLYRVMLGRWSPEPILTCAESGSEALDCLTQDCPDVLILDLQLSDMHGRDIVEYIRAREQFHSMKIVVVSGTTCINIRIQTKLGEGICCLSKPIDFRELKNIIY